MRLRGGFHLDSLNWTRTVPRLSLSGVSSMAKMCIFFAPLMVRGELLEQPEGVIHRQVSPSRKYASVLEVAPSCLYAAPPSVRTE